MGWTNGSTHLKIEEQPWCARPACLFLHVCSCQHLCWACKACHSLHSKVHSSSDNDRPHLLLLRRHVRHMIDVFAFLILVLALVLGVLAWVLARLFRIAARWLRKNGKQSHGKKQL